MTLGITRKQLQKFLDWWTLNDYEAAKEKATEDIVSRYARGSVLVQNGSVIDEAEHAALVKRGDLAFEKLKKIFGQA